MIDYLKSILPRIQQYSKQLNDEVNFVDIPWSFLEDDGSKVTYLFRRKGELLVSRQGEVATGSWEYLPMMQSMLIEYQNRKRMFNQGFIDRGVMILRKDGTDELFPLANPQLIPDLDIEKYLDRAVNTISKKPEFHLEKKDRPKVKRTIVGSSQKEIFLWGDSGKSLVNLEGNPLATYLETDLPVDPGEYELLEGGKIIIKEGRVEKIEYEDSGSMLLLTAVLIILLIVVMILLI